MSSGRPEPSRRVRAIRTPSRSISSTLLYLLDEVPAPEDGHPRHHQGTDEPLTGHYRTAYGRNIRGGTKVARTDVAHHMLRVLDEPDSIGQTVGIAGRGPRR
ncbi:hypothetical protein ACIP3D_15315 [Streptomyces longwoodensis]|uniref:hypothetical protein n=1 Tax=Streptomyces longwoodensis TaxID=68231 RepID=UPI003807D2CB